MTPEQLKLINKLSKIVDVTIIQKGIESLRKAISSMDIEALELILEDDVSYQETTKTIFLNKLNELFLEFKKEDSKLIPYKGKCISEECSNKNMNGISFVGNNSGRFINLIVDHNENFTISDIFTCHIFCTNNKEKSKEFKREFKITIYENEKVNFSPSKNYLFINNKVVSAINQLKHYQKKAITKNELTIWVNKYEEIYDELLWSPLYSKEQSVFYSAYGHLKHVLDYFNLEDRALIAFTEFKTINSSSEKELLNWLVKYEDLNKQLSLLYYDIIYQENIELELNYLYKDFEIYFKTDLLKNCIKVYDMYQKYFYEKFKKHNTLPKEEYINLNMVDDDSEKKSTLKYHLKKEE